MMNLNRKPLKIGHKGASLIAPENTLLSFQKAIELDADYVEFDIHLTSDNQIVISHDPDTMYATGIKKVIKETSLKELKKLNFGKGEKIPTLHDLIRLASSKIKLQPEIKTQGIAELIVPILRDDNLLETTIISSFGITELLKVQQLESSSKIGYLIPSELTKMSFLKRYVKKANNYGFYAIHPHYNSITSEFVDYCHDHGLKVNVWTVNEEKSMRKIIELNVDGIITDDLVLLNRVIDEVF